MSSQIIVSYLIFPFILSMALLYFFKPLVAFHQDGKVKCYGMGLDKNQRQKTIFTPLTLSMLFVVISNNVTLI
jgi:hypothetical protein